MEQFNRLMGVISVILITAFLLVVAVVAVSGEKPSKCQKAGSCVVVESDPSSRYNNYSKR